VRDALVKDAAEERGKVFDETEIRATLHQQRLDLFAAQEAKRTAKTKEDRRQASDSIVQALDDEGASLEDLASQGKLTQKDVDRFTSDAKANLGSMSKDGQTHVQGLIDKYTELLKLPDLDKKFTFTAELKGNFAPGALDKVAKKLGYFGNQDLYKKDPFKATGGAVDAHMPYIVGERGAELFVPNASGTIIPHGAAMAMVASGASGQASGGDITVNIGRVDRQSIADLRRELKVISDRRRKGWDR
jgi:hypothetical protein